MNAATLPGVIRYEQVLDDERTRAIAHINPTTIAAPEISVSPKDVVTNDRGPGGVQIHSRAIVGVIVLDQVVLDQGIGIAADVHSSAKLTVVLTDPIPTDRR